MKYINKAFENALVQIQYWKDWEILFQKFSSDISARQYNDKENEFSKAVQTLRHYILEKELSSWQHAMMFGLVQPNETRQKIAALAKERFLIGCDENEHFKYSIGNYLDPNNLPFAHIDPKIEEEFRKEIRKHFDLKDENI